MAPEKIQKYDKLPPATGIPFSGFEYAKIESRAPIAKTLETFLNIYRNAKSLNVAVIRAEWGEGKTDAYERYIKPEAENKNDFVYHVSTSTIVRVISKSDDLFPLDNTASSIILASVFYALKDELRARNESDNLFPNYLKSKDKEGKGYIDKTLRTHFPEKNNKRMFIFIDEFEEILTSGSENQKAILSGIKELVNGQLKLIHEGGEFEGKVHFIIASTPYAYNRIVEDVELAQIFGSFASRVKLIDLPQIRKKEAIQFLIDLIKYSYSGKLPIQLPFKSSGIFNGVYTISQRNIRALLQLYIEIMSSAARNGDMEVIDYILFINALKGKELTLYGGSTKCIDDDLLLKIEDTLLNIRTHGERCANLFRLFVGELHPFSINEINNRLVLSSESSVHSIVEMINQELKKIGIQEAIMRFCPLKEGSSEKAVIDSIGPIDGEIVILDARLSVEKFIDELVYYDVDSTDKLISTIIFPKEREDLQLLFDLTEAQADILYKRAFKYFEETAKERCYMLSKELINQLFPSPTWLLIDFIKDRNKRMELWREVLKSFSENVWRFRDGLVEVLNKSEKIKIEPDKNNFPLYNLNYILTSGRNVKIITHIYCSVSRITLNDVKELRLIINNKNPNLILLIHSGEIDDDARDELSGIVQVLPIHVRTIRAQQLQVFALAKERNIEFNAGILEIRLKDILYELEFSKNFDAWIENCRNNGSLVDELQSFYGFKDEHLASALKFYINFMGDEKTSIEIFSKGEELRNFTFYRQNTPFAPIDIDSEDKLKEYQNDLISNGFLEEKIGAKILVKTTPVEKKILDLLNKKKMSISQLKNYFIILSSNEKIIEQVYISILEHKGLIKSSGDELTLTNKIDMESLNKEEFLKYDSRIKTKKSGSWWTYAHICVSKEKGDRIIRINEFDEYVNRLYQTLEIPEVKYNEELYLQKSHLLQLLLRHFKEKLESRIDSATKKSLEILNNAKENLEDIEYGLDGILLEYNDYCKEKKYSKIDIEDFRKVSELYNVILDIDKRIYSREHLEKELSRIRKTSKIDGKLYFFFGRTTEEASYFNFKLMELDQKYNSFSEKYIGIKNRCGTINNGITNCNNIKSKIKGKILTYKIESEFQASQKLRDRLLECKLKPIEASLIYKPSLEDIEKFFDSVYGYLNQYYNQAEENLKQLDAILKAEATILKKKDELTQKAEIFTKFFDVEGEPTSWVKEAQSKISSTVQQYTGIVKEIQETKEIESSMDKLGDYLKKINERMGKLVKSFNEVNDQFAELLKYCKNFLDIHEKNVERFITVLKEGGIDVSMFGNELTQIVKQGKSELDNLGKTMKISGSWKTLLAELDSFRDKLYKEVKKFLPEDEFNVLFLIVQMLSKSKWMDLSDVIKETGLKLKKNDKEISEIISHLSEKKLLKNGVSLPI